MDLKSSSIGLGSGIAKGLGAYTTNHGPAKGSSPTAVPRDNGGLANGQTSGNFAASSLSKVPNNSTATGTESGATEAADTFASNANG